MLWEKDGQPVSPNSLAGAEYSEDNQILKVPEMTTGPASRFTCTGKNKAGAVSRDFFVETIGRACDKHKRKQIYKIILYFFKHDPFYQQEQTEM